MFRFGVNRVEYLPLEGGERHLAVKVAAPDGDQWRLTMAGFFRITDAILEWRELLPVWSRISAVWLLGDADLVGIEKAELRTDFGRVLLVDKVDSVFPFPLKFWDELGVKNMKAAFKIPSSAANCGADDGSWSLAAAEAKGGWIVVEFACVLASNAARTLELNNSGNVDAAGQDIGLGAVPEESEMMGSCWAKADLKPQPCGAKPGLSLLMMSAA
jgi:hypothetical protein